jgi:His-Xaa-Ser repeat protein HxsA
MKRRTYLIPTIAAAGFGHQDPAVAAVLRAATTGSHDPTVGTLMRVFNQDHMVTLADHRSHSSHASHSSGYGGGGHYSHTSHRSGAGGYDGGGYSGVPLYTPPAPTPPPVEPIRTPSAQPLFTSSDRATAPPPDGLPALSGRTKRFAAIVRRVQIALIAQDFYRGPISGVVAPTLRAALRKFQKDRGLDVTGTITPQTLDALMVSSS